MKTESSTTAHHPYNTDWKSDFKNSIQTKEELELFCGQEFPEVNFSLFIPRPFLQKILEAGINSPLGKQFLPHIEELEEGGKRDPIGDQAFSKGAGVIHRYKNRILYSPTEICPIHCRYCFRKNELGKKNPVFKSQLEMAIEYVQTHPEIEEVILTGGDPLILGDAKLEFILESFANLKQIKMLRLHSRTPIILPNRINDDLVQLFRRIQSKVQVLSLVIHTNHPSEWTPELLRGLQRLRPEPIHLLSQSVLLKGVNDDVVTLKTLFTHLVSWGVQPYYLHHPDDVLGAQHFRLSLKEGREIYRNLKAEVSGFILPKYVIELPEGSGKAHAYSDQQDRFTWVTHKGEKIPFQPL